MVPLSLSRKLSQLRRRETILRLTWGAARWLALVLSLLLLACLIDWTLDQDEDTPWPIRIALTVSEGGTALAAAWYFLILPLVGQPNDSELALWVEDKNPRLEHRLISAVQLNQPGALTEGMSKELIAVVTREAEQEAKRIPFARLADHRRVRWSGVIAGPVLLLALILVLIWPELSLALLSRQLLLDRDIPRSIALASLTPEVWPSGEKLTLRFQATGKDIDKATGHVLVQPDEAPTDSYPLQLQEMKNGEAIFAAALPSMTSDFSYRAWLGDGRLPRTQRLRFVPRPVVEKIEARVLLPSFCGVKPDGARYEKSQPRGDVGGIPGSTARLLIQVQKPVRTAFVEILGQTGANGDDNGKSDKAEEPVRRKVALTLDESGTLAEGTFDLKPEEIAYRVVVTDEYGFANLPPPRRTLKLIPEDPPQVALLREQALFPPGEPGASATGELAVEEVDLEGMPVPAGRPIRIGYSASGSYGLGHARLLYRLVKKSESGNEGEEEPWQILPLTEVKAPRDGGDFVPTYGVFQKNGPRDQVPFYAVPSSDPKHVLGRLRGGGRLNFQTTNIPDGKGNFAALREGDQIEYCVEVHADRNAKSGRPFARSETRVKNIVSVEDFARWRYELSQEQERLTKLEAKQGGVFSGK